jgi:uncharacterized membrane protein
MSQYTTEEKGLGCIGTIFFLILTSVFTPIITFILAYLMWHDKEPKKWNTAKIILITIFIIEAFLAVIFISGFAAVSQIPHN